ncbi:hypothetical protein ACHAWX_006679 [Stephanocyclus meneghinianus]
MPFSTHPLANHYCGTSDSPFAFRDHTSHKSVSASLRTLEQQSIMSRVDLTSIPARPTDGGEMNATIDTATHDMIKSAGAAQRTRKQRAKTLKLNRLLREKEQQHEQEMWELERQRRERRVKEIDRQIRQLKAKHASLKKQVDLLENHSDV